MQIVTMSPQKTPRVLLGDLEPGRTFVSDTGVLYLRVEATDLHGPGRQQALITAVCLADGSVHTFPLDGEVTPAPAYVVQI